MKRAARPAASQEASVSPPLILAIQPDRRQAAHLSAIAKKISAELILTESAARAVAALGERLPDLILTPPLLSLKDEKAITERLHEFGEAGAHIQTLTIPIFETTEAPASKGGVLSSLRKSKRKGHASSSGAVPSPADAFAEQVSIYLSSAVQARRAALPRIESRAETPEPAAPADAPPPQPMAAPEPPPEPAVAQPPEDARSDAAQPTADTLPTIEELLARTPAVPEPDRSVEARIADFATSVPAVDLTPAPATPVDTRMETVAALVPDTPGTTPDMPLPVPAPASPQLAVELQAAELAAMAAADPAEAPALPDASVEASVDAAAVAAVDAAMPEPAALPLPETTPLATLRVDLSSMPLDQAAPESAPVPAPEAAPLAPIRVDLASLPLDEAPPESTAAHVPEAMPLAALRVDLPSVVTPAGAASHDDMAPIPAATPLATLRVDLSSMPVAEGPSASPVAEMPAATALAALRVDLPAADAAIGELAAIPQLSGQTDEAGIDAVAAMAPLVDAAPDTCPVPAIASIPHVTGIPVELHALAGASLHDSAPLVSPSSVLSMEMNATAFVPMAADDGAPMDGVIAIPDAAPMVMTVPMTISSADLPTRAVMPPVPDATAAAMSAQRVTGIVPPDNGHVELALPQPPTIASDVAMRLSPVDIAGLTTDHALIAAAVPAQPPVRITERLAAIVPLAPTPEQTVAVPAPAISYIAELPSQLLSTPVPVAARDGIPAVVPPDTTPRANVSAVVPPPHKRMRKQLSLKERKAARKANRTRTDRLDDSSLFNPDECRFAALVAKLDEVAPGFDESRVGNAAAASQAVRRKGSKRR